MDLFTRRDIDPMLIAQRMEPFDDPRYLYELKFDGERCIAFVGDGMTDLRNKRHRAMLGQFPELSYLHKYVSGRCVLDGELFVMTDGKPDFGMVQARSITTNAIKISMRSKKYPATYLAFDILYRDGESLLNKPLVERKCILSDVVKREDDRFALSHVYDCGTVLFDLTGEMGLEGVVAKRRNSIYRLGKRTKDWIKFKHFVDKDFVAAGYVKKPDATSLVLGLYDDGHLVYQGHLTLGVTLAKVRSFSTSDTCPFEYLPRGNEGAVWFDPLRVCSAKYMYRLESGGLRQPVFVGFRDDIMPTDCVVSDE